MKGPSQLATVRQWLAEPVPRDVAAAIDRLARTDDVKRVAVMPDVHLARDVCTGIVLATRQRLYPQVVGNDIGCGMATIRLNGRANLLADETAAGRLLAGLYRTIPAIRHPRHSSITALPASLDQPPLSHPALEKRTRRDGRVEFATLGRGNHFLEVQEDQDENLWILVHSGSRALGQAINIHHLRHALAGNTGLLYLEAESPAGAAYLEDMTWACRYAEESRREMIERVAALMEEIFEVSADPNSVLHCSHNHLRQEKHFGENLWVHRKGAVSALTDEPAIIPGSMGTPSFHVLGRGNAEALCSSSHGAGRRLSRTEARHTIKEGDLERQLKEVWFDHRMVSQLRDEAPAAYKDIHAVMRAQRGLTKIVRRLRPVLNYKAG